MLKPYTHTHTHWCFCIWPANDISSSTVLFSSRAMPPSWPLANTHTHTRRPFNHKQIIKICFIIDSTKERTRALSYRHTFPSGFYSYVLFDYINAAKALGLWAWRVFIKCNLWSSSTCRFNLYRHRNSRLSNCIRLKARAKENKRWMRRQTEESLQTCGKVFTLLKATSVPWTEL